MTGDGYMLPLSLLFATPAAESLLFTAGSLVGVAKNCDAVNSLLSSFPLVALVAPEGLLGCSASSLPFTLADGVLGMSASPMVLPDRDRTLTSGSSTSQQSSSSSIGSTDSWHNCSRMFRSASSLKSLTPPTLTSYTPPGNTQRSRTKCAAFRATQVLPTPAPPYRITQRLLSAFGKIWAMVVQTSSCLLACYKTHSTDNTGADWTGKRGLRRPHNISHLNRKTANAVIKMNCCHHSLCDIAVNNACENTNDAPANEGRLVLLEDGGASGGAHLRAAFRAWHREQHLVVWRRAREQHEVTTARRINSRVKRLDNNITGQKGVEQGQQVQESYTTQNRACHHV